MTREVVTGILVRGGRILLLRRSAAMKSMPGLWAGVSGSVEGGEPLLSRMLLEIEEELGIPPEGLVLLCRGEPVVVNAEGRRWRVHPFLFEAGGTDIRLNCENSEYGWVAPGDVTQFDTVPGLDRVLLGLL